MIRWKDIALRMTVFMMLAVSAVWACHSPADDGRKGYAASKEITVQTHTQDEIRDYVSRHGATLQDGLYFAADPVLEAPYGAGQLSDATKKSALNMLRQIRYIAGISDQIEESGTYSYYAQLRKRQSVASSRTAGRYGYGAVSGRIRGSVKVKSVDVQQKRQEHQRNDRDVFSKRQRSIEHFKCRTPQMAAESKDEICWLWRSQRTERYVLQYLCTG